jgi:pimeloyl-ACP methyl ester carboxylesterase
MLIPSRVATRTGSFEVLQAGAASAPLVLLLHGFPDTPHGWRGVAGHLVAAGYRVAAPYLRGYHPSVLSGPYHLDQIADDIIALVDALSPNRSALLAGHDWGAIAAYPALNLSPGRFARAVTMSVPHPQAFVANLKTFPGQLRMSWYMIFFQIGKRADRTVAADDFELVERLWSQWSPGFRPDEAYLAELKRCLGASLPAPLEYYRSLFRPLRDAIRRGRRKLDVRVPTLNLHGARDGCVDVRMAANQEKFFRGPFEARVLPHVGHFMQLEDPAGVAAMMIDWFSK